VTQIVEIKPHNLMVAEPLRIRHPMTVSLFAP